LALGSSARGLFIGSQHPFPQDFTVGDVFQGFLIDCLPGAGDHVAFDQILRVGTFLDIPVLNEPVFGDVAIRPDDNTEL
jgi:hypothetical protein